MQVDSLAQRRPLAEPGTGFYVFGNNSKDHIGRVGDILGVKNWELTSRGKRSYLGGENRRILAMKMSELDEPFLGLDFEAAKTDAVAFRDIAGDTHFGVRRSVHIFQDFGDHEGVMFVNARLLPDGRHFRYSTLGFNSQQPDGYALRGGKIVEETGGQEKLMQAIRLAAHFDRLGFDEIHDFVKTYS